MGWGWWGGREVQEEGAIGTGEADSLVIQQKTTALLSNYTPTGKKKTPTMRHLFSGQNKKIKKTTGYFTLYLLRLLIAEAGKI